MFFYNAVMQFLEAGCKLSWRLIKKIKFKSCDFQRHKNQTKSSLFLDFKILQRAWLQNHFKIVGSKQFNPKINSVKPDKTRLKQI